MRASRGALLTSLLSAGQDPESIAEVFAAVDKVMGSAGGISSPDARVTRDQWREAVVLVTSGPLPGADGGEPEPASDQTGDAKESANKEPAAADERAPPHRRKLFVEDIDTLTLYVGCTLYCQTLLLQREHAAATPVLRELINLAPPLLRATFEGWGYSRGYCLLEQLWLEAYAGVISASLHARDATTRAEGSAMAAQLISMIQGKISCRHMRHTVAEWACELAPDAARPLLMLGEAMLDQPLSGHDESEAEPVLRRALDAHRRELQGEQQGAVSSSAVCGVAADALYWSAVARALDEVSLGARDPEAIELLREGLRWLPHEIELYLQLGTLLERADCAGAIALYASFPQPPDGSPPSFDHAVIANSAVRLILDQKDFGNGDLVRHLVTVGLVLGVLNIEKYVQVLDAHNELDVIKQVYQGITPDFDQSNFFKSKGWMQ